MNYEHLFGPVPSRRLGVSLGVDIVPFKYCSMNCIYCEIGRTTNLTMRRDEYVPFDEVRKELNDYLSSNPELDYITFSGAGEPTLNSRIGAMVSFIKKEYPKYKLALITNSSLLPDTHLRKEIRDIDLILPSLDAVTQEVFEKINRPCPALKTADIVKGLIAFRQESDAEMWLEIFFLPGINDHATEVSLLKETVQRINPHRVQLNSLDRPGTERWLIKEPQNKLEQIAQFLKPLPVEIISRKTVDMVFPEIDQQLEDKLISTIKRRPCTADDMAKILHLHIDEVAKYLHHLAKKGVITATEQETGVFYSLNDKE
ncbi:MAG: radical SAM protein [Candidatus Cloacimonetes bacterium]|nr:radical SAM protein [Candidatus Cloacimonadota bacterium]